MTPLARFEHLHGWVIHRRAWRESSLLVEFFSREQGRVGLVAKGARSARSAWRGQIEPYIPLSASWLRRGEVGTMTALESLEAGLALTGQALWCGFYANELVLRLLKRDDPHPEVFDAYSAALVGLAQGEKAQALVLRRFEMELLRGLGVAPDFRLDAQSGRPISPDKRYHLKPDAGFFPADDDSNQTFSGQTILALADGHTTSRTAAREMRALMRRLIDPHLGGRPLASRQLLASVRTRKHGD